MDWIGSKEINVAGDVKDAARNAMNDVGANRTLAALKGRLLFWVIAQY
jgi:hypothetical protein